MQLFKFRVHRDRGKVSCTVVFSKGIWQDFVPKAFGDPGGMLPWNEGSTLVWFRKVHGLGQGNSAILTD